MLAPPPPPLASTAAAGGPSADSLTKRIKRLIDVVFKAQRTAEAKAARWGLHVGGFQNLKTLGVGCLVLVHGSFVDPLPKELRM